MNVTSWRKPGNPTRPRHRQLVFVASIDTRVDRASLRRPPIQLARARNVVIGYDEQPSGPAWMTPVPLVLQSSKGTVACG
jgi:hypothetical protein